MLYVHFSQSMITFFEMNNSLLSLILFILFTISISESPFHGKEFSKDVNIVFNESFLRSFY